jgi:hypothetical protein
MDDYIFLFAGSDNLTRVPYPGIKTIFKWNCGVCSVRGLDFSYR